jgi:hypothetical protein
MKFRIRVFLQTLYHFYFIHKIVKTNDPLRYSWKDLLPRDDGHDDASTRSSLCRLSHWLASLRRLPSARNRGSSTWTNQGTGIIKVVPLSA